MSDPNKTQELPACAPERQTGWNPTPTNPKTPPPPRREPEHDAVELPARSSSAQDDALEAWFRAGMFFFAVVVLPILLAYKWGA